VWDVTELRVVRPFEYIARRICYYVCHVPEGPIYHMAQASATKLFRHCYVSQIQITVRSDHM
jgi:hypothetical protein